MQITMKVCTVAFGVLVACAAAMALEPSPLIRALQPVEAEEQPTQLVPVYIQPTDVQGPRQKRSLLLGAAGLGGLAVLGAGALGVGLIGAKAGLVGGALAAGALQGRGFGGGYGYGGGYGGYHYGGGYGAYGGGYGGYGGGYGGYRSYPTYVVEESWC
ncbi:keratin-associated protein 19-2-like isoform X1 [Cydia splendana]|uniref:keratin-associated protein 19-2-like isoform X1 n=2 Tax=Cydia splendana TaxID=1100963 RepID=UPI00300CDDAE